MPVCLVIGFVFNLCCFDAVFPSAGVCITAAVSVYLFLGASVSVLSWCCMQWSVYSSVCLSSHFQRYIEDTQIVKWIVIFLCYVPIH